MRDGTTVPGVTREAVAGSRTITDLVDANAVSRRHGEGATLVLNSLHRFWPPLVEFCRDLAMELGHPTQCNAYITPAGDAKGFAFHHDTHDVFVLQVTGRKRWQVHQPVITLPTKSQPRSGADLVPDGQPPLIDTELGPGDTLYLPRGYVHAAATTDSRSLHLTVGVLAITWYDVLRDVVATAADELSFRHALPVSPHDALEQDPDQLAAVLQQAAAWLSALPVERARELLEARVRKAAPAEPLRLLAQAEAVAGCAPDFPVRPRRGLRWSIQTAGERVTLQLPDCRLDLPAYTADALRRALTTPGTPAELGAAGLGLDADDAVVLVRRLLREGALVGAG
ncbi:MAG TPA: cupin domain-containing protein [Mycobacteriales bacterium]|nr:cupin domain-containing protein [Mycobacteriales bacterium]